MVVAKLASLAAFVLSLAACSGGSSSEDAGPRHDGSSRADVHAEAASKSDAKTDGAPKDAGPNVDVLVPNRAPGQRTPLSATCDPVDPTRCLTPWPSNTFTVVDPTTPTGLRVNVAQSAVIDADTPVSINRADGFSRVSPIETGFPVLIDKSTLGDQTTGCVRLLVEQPGETFGQVVPLRFDTTASSDGVTTLLIAYPRVPLAPDTDYAVVVVDSVKSMSGQPLTADHEAQIALGLTPVETSAEAALYAYDAPAREAMKAAGLDPSHAVRVWDFTTRSLNDPTGDLVTMRDVEVAAFDRSPVGGDAGVPVVDGSVLATDAAASDAGPGLDGAASSDASATGDAAAPVGLAIDSISTAPSGTVETAILGRITSVPSYLNDAGALYRDDGGAPVAHGVHDVPFRVAVPTGSGDYRLVMYGHGTGGSYDETSFDEEITSGGACKVGTQFIGWTGTTIDQTFSLFTRVLAASDISTAGLTQSLADSMLVEHALAGSLGRLLGAPVLAGAVNPSASRHPNVALPVWAGGSLGGTMGFVYSAADPDITAAVLNVPGAAWAQFVVYSELFEVVKLIMSLNYPDPIDVSLGVAEAQLDFDPVDGAVWHDAVGDHFPILLEQQSMGDPVLPNIGNEMVAAASHADQVGVVLDPIVTCPDVTQASNHNGMTQFKVPDDVTAPLQIHGFAANDSPAGVAAQQQIVSFIASVWSGTPLITVPPECMTNTPPGSCDFSNDYDGGQ